LSLLNFINKECYFSRFNIDSVTGKRINKNRKKGKYLNQIHNFFIKFNFYDQLYDKILAEYLKVTNYATLAILSTDSSFVINKLGNDLSRNPEYHNKPGLKVHTLVDSP
jgi:hypothetical protein